MTFDSTVSIHSIRTAPIRAKVSDPSFQPLSDPVPPLVGSPKLLTRLNETNQTSTFKSPTVFTTEYGRKWPVIYSFWLLLFCFYHFPTLNFDVQKTASESKHNKVRNDWKKKKNKKNKAQQKKYIKTSSGGNFSAMATFQ